MANKSGGKQGGTSRPSDPDHDEKLRMRREFGITGLPAGEELMNTAIFSRVQLDAALKRRSLAEGDAPGSPAPDEELLLEEITTEAPVRRRGDLSALHPAATSAEVADFETEMMLAKDRDAVAELALRIATYYATSAAIFVVKDGIVAGQQRAGEGLASGIDAVMIPVDAESLICRPAATGKLSRQCAPLGEVDRRVMRAMGRSDAREVLVLPVRMDDTVVNLLYVDNGEGALPDTAVGALRVLAVGITKAYERLASEADGR
jgi:hypothetical protein